MAAALLSDAEAALVRIREIREAIYELFLSHIQNRSPDPAAVESVNGVLAEGLRNRRLKPGDGEFCWTWTEQPERLESQCNIREGRGERREADPDGIGGAEVRDDASRREVRGQPPLDLRPLINIPMVPITPVPRNAAANSSCPASPEISAQMIRASSAMKP